MICCYTPSLIETPKLTLTLTLPAYIMVHSAELFWQALEILKTEPNALELKAPIKIVGDLHGQFFDLISMLDNCGAPRDGSR